MSLACFRNEVEQLQRGVERAEPSGGRDSERDLLFRMNLLVPITNFFTFS